MPDELPPHGRGGSGLMVQPASAWLGKFIREVDQAIARVIENPLAFPVILRRHEVRRVLTKRLLKRTLASWPVKGIGYEQIDGECRACGRARIGEACFYAMS